MSDTASLGIRVTQQGITQADAALERLRRTGRETERQVDDLQDSFQDLNARGAANQAVMRQGASANAAFGRSAGQAAIQVQQFTGQVQGGTNALLALSQQGADLGIVLGAPLVGVAISLAAALALVVTGADDAGRATEELEDALDSLDEITETTADGIDILTESVARLAQQDERAARLQIALGLAEAETVVARSIDTFNEFTEEYDAFIDNFGFGSDDLEDAAAQFAILQRRNIELTDALLETGQASNGAFVGVSDLSGVVNELNEDFGLTTAQSARLLESFFAFDQNQTPETFSALSSTVQDLSIETDFANEAFVRFSATTLQTAQQIENAEERADFLRRALGNLDQVAQESLDATDTALQRAERARESQIQRLDTGTQSILDSLISEQETQIQTVQDQIVTLGEARDEQLISERQFQQASAQLWSEYYEGIDAQAEQSAATRRQVEATVLNNSLNAVQTATQTLLQFTEEGSALGQAAFIANQALSAAIAFNQGEVAATAALAPPPIGLGPVAGVGLATSIRAQTVASIGAITAQTVAGLARAQGGDFGAGQSVLVGERGPEVVTFDQPGTVTTNAALQSGGDTGSVTIIQQITVQGNGDEALISAMQQAARSGADQAVQRVFQDTRQNGPITRSLRG